MKQILRWSIVLIFAAYWSITLLYNSPESYIKIKADPVLSKFEVAFYQKWSFFAPPADFNFRLYFQYFGKDSTQVAVYEILKPIALQKQQHAPFNAGEQFIDYVVNGAIIEINDLLLQHYKSSDFAKPERTKEQNYADAVKSFGELAEKNNFSGYATLRNYFREHYRKNVALNSSLGSASYGIMLLTQQKIPRFDNRDSLLLKNYTPQESPIFYSSPVQLR